MSSYGLWLSAAGMKVISHRQAILANNMANMNTTGFKYDLAVVTQRRVESEASTNGLGLAHPVLDDLAGGVNVKPTHQNFGQGSIERTGKPLDIAIAGDGFFSVSNGEVTRYTRDGEFTINATGELILAAGDGKWRILDDGGQPITIDRSAGSISVSQDGTIRQGEAIVAAIGLVSTEDQQGLRKVGENLFEATGDMKMTPISGRLVPEAREASNFNIMRGLASMIEGARAYQLNANMVQLQDKLTKLTASTVGRIK